MQCQEKWVEFECPRLLQATGKEENAEFGGCSFTGYS